MEVAGTVSEAEYYQRYPNRWARIRYSHSRNTPSTDRLTNNPFLCARDKIREPAAELLGTMIFVLCGTGGICQVVLGGSTSVVSSSKGDWLSLVMGWAVGEPHSHPGVSSGFS